MASAVLNLDRMSIATEDPVAVRLLWNLLATRVTENDNRALTRAAGPSHSPAQAR